MSEKMCTCKTCGQQVANSATKCPHCGAKEKKARPGLICIVTLSIIAIMGIGCGTGETANTSNNTPTKAPISNAETTENIPTSAVEATVPEATAKENKDACGVGDTAELKNVLVSFLSITESTGSSYNTPSEGNVFVLCEFEIQNNTNAELNVSSMLSFEAYCDEYACNYSLGALMEKGNSNQLDGTVAVGKKLKGVIGYEVPVDWKELEIHFTPDVWSGKDIVFIAVNE